MREVNNHIKEIIGVKETKPQQPKPSFNPLKWNWTAIITWSAIGFITYTIFKFLINLI